MSQFCALRSTVTAAKLSQILFMANLLPVNYFFVFPKYHHLLSLTLTYSVAYSTHLVERFGLSKDFHKSERTLINMAAVYITVANQLVVMCGQLQFPFILQNSISDLSASTPEQLEQQMNLQIGILCIS